MPNIVGFTKLQLDFFDNDAQDDIATCRMFLQGIGEAGSEGNRRGPKGKNRQKKLGRLQGRLEGVRSPIIPA